MANKARAKSSTEPQPIPQTHITIGGNVANSNIIAGDNNVINVLPAGQPASLHQLPTPPGDFVGRAEALEQILKQERSAISGLSGLGGVGKTALGLVAAHKLAEKYPDAQFFLDLRGASQNPLTPQEAMRHVILSFDPLTDLRPYNDELLRGLYLNLLNGKHVLLFFDNARDAAQVRPLLPPPCNAVLLTSRTHFTLEGMGEPLRLDVLPENEAQRLLTKICPRLGDAAPRLAQLCGCLPLALRIAATFLVEHLDWTPLEYLGRLVKQRLKTLQVEGDPQQNVEAVFELSYAQLNAGEQAHWRELAVFTAPFTRPALAAVTDLEEAAARDLAGKLHRLCLLEFNAETNRYFLHDLLRDFAAARLDVQVAFAAHQRQAEYFMGVAKQANRLYLKGGENIVLGLALFDRDWVHIQAGQAWASQNLKTGAAELAMRLPDAGAYLLNLRLHPREQICWLETALRAARFLKHKEAEGAALGNLGTAYKNLGNTRRAIKFHKQCLAIARETGDRRGEGAALGNLGVAYKNLGETRRAIKFHKQYLAIARETGDRRGEGIALGNLGVAYKNLGETRRAIELLEQCLAIAREIGDRYEEGIALGNLGNAYRNLGAPRRAIEYFEQDLVIAHEIGDRRSVGNCLFNSGLAYQELGDLTRARQLGRQALEIYVAIEDPRAEITRKWLEELG